MSEIETVCFRVDMNEKIATGHMMRCLSIARTAKRLGINVFFVLSDKNAVDLLEKFSIEYIVIGSMWDKPESEIEKLISVIHEKNIKNLVVDKYEITEKYLYDISKETRVWYIDDIKKFKYPVYGIINYTFGAEESKEEKVYSLGSKLLLGSIYSPLRESFKKYTKPHKIRSKIKDILILSGGGNETVLIERLIDCFVGYDELHITTICGRLCKNVDALREKYKGIEIHQNVDNIENYMSRADLAISAGGSTVYELCACGTPSMIYSVADNQMGNVKELINHKIAIYVGDVRNDDLKSNIKDALIKLNNPKVRQELSRKMQKLVDGKGAERIISEILFQSHF